MSFDARDLLGAVEPDELDAVLETMVLAAHADGEFGDEERALILRSLAALGQGTRHEAAMVDTRLEEMLSSLGTASPEQRQARLAGVRKRLPRLDSRRAAFGLAVQVVAADGFVRTSEREALLDLASSLELEPDEAAELVRRASRSSQ